MGLDLAFNREQAIAAGMEVSSQRNGTDGEIQETLSRFYEGYDEQAEPRLFWLESYQYLVRIPDEDFWLVDSGNKDRVIVRANKWGESYEPITQFLTDNNIQWSEF